jgi:uncharacterized membrane protein YoaK (UPF0700 family)
MQNLQGCAIVCWSSNLEPPMSDTHPAAGVGKILFLPVLLSLNAGYVDAAGFLALQGLFTAHVTGNFVTLGAAVVLGTTGIVAKLLALPVFCIGVLLTRLLAFRLAQTSRPELKVLLGLQIALLALAAGLALGLGPFHDGDAVAAIVTGMVLVAAMSIQNAIQRLYLSSAPPTTLMTGTTTQVMIDIASLFHGVADSARGATLSRMRQMLAGIAAFALGCGLAAGLFAGAGMLCFILPPLFALAALAVRA